jgi:hypothetical protein
MVEFALVFPIFLLLLFGLIDIGRYVYTVNAVNQAAREAARFGSVASWSNDCASSRIACVEQESLGRLAGVRTDTITFDVKCRRFGANGWTDAGSSCGANDTLSVRLTTKFQILTPIIGQFIGPAPVVGFAQVTVNQ